jgi:hypothetical protein
MGLALAVRAQVLPADVIALSPFTVNAAADRGCRAENTLVGSRLDTGLRATPSSVRVFTGKFPQVRNLRSIRLTTTFAC